MNPTNIEYLTHTWNPIAMRCTPVGPGCAHCWHIQMANRLAKNPSILFNESNAYSGLEKPYLVRSRLDQPLKHKKPARIGVQFMGDLFHEDVEYDQINQIFGIMYKCPDTFLLLTKRPKQMYEFLKNHVYMGAYWFDIDPKYHSNIWLGISAENQQTADERIPILLQIPAAKRFVSLEPLLSSVDLLTYLPNINGGINHESTRNGLSGTNSDWCIYCGQSRTHLETQKNDGRESNGNSCLREEIGEADSGREKSVSLSYNHVHRKQPTDESVCSQNCVDGHKSGRYSSRNGDQSQRREKREQLSIKFRGCNQETKRGTQLQGIATEEKSTERRNKCHGKIEQGTSDGNSPIMQTRANNTAKNSPDVRSSSGNYICNSCRKKLESSHQGLDLVIIGGLSLPGRRTYAPDPKWIDNIVEQCDVAGVPLFIKDNAQYHTKREEFPR